MAELVAEQLRVEFPLYFGGSRSLKKALMSRASLGRVGHDAKDRIVVEALRGVNLSLATGDRMGLIGGNGAGKTTLLRVLAGIYEPVEGRVFTDGRVTSLIDPNLGMNMDLSGRENIALRGLYLGLTPAQIRSLEEDVIAFAGLAEFVDMPLRTYSSGMVVRLGFALATGIHPQILLMDEWFLAGDAAFMEKARVRLETLISGVEILVLSTHMLTVIEEWCTRIMWLDGGRVRMDGGVAETLAEYRVAMSPPYV